MQRQLALDELKTGGIRSNDYLHLASEGIQAILFAWALRLACKAAFLRTRKTNESKNFRDEVGPAGSDVSRRGFNRFFDSLHEGDIGPDHVLTALEVP